MRESSVDGGAKKQKERQKPEEETDCKNRKEIVKVRKLVRKYKRVRDERKLARKKDRENEREKLQDGEGVRICT